MAKLSVYTQVGVYHPDIGKWEVAKSSKEGEVPLTPEEVAAIKPTLDVYMKVWHLMGYDVVLEE
jgi:hypothetical protein